MVYSPTKEGNTRITQRFFRKKIIPLRPPPRFSDSSAPQAPLPTQFFWKSWFHNIASPLSTILSLCDELSDQLPPRERDQIISTAHHLQQIFIHGRSQLTGNPPPLTLFSITETLLILAPILEHLGAIQGIEVILWCDQVAWVRGHQPVLEQILMILWNNALESIGQSQLEVKRITTKLHVDDTVVRIEVSNTGPAIPSDIREKIFSAEFSTKNRTRNSGLGLPFVRFHMENTFQGECSLVESPDYPCRFVLTFPRASVSAR